MKRVYLLAVSGLLLTSCMSGDGSPSKTSVVAAGHSVQLTEFAANPSNVRVYLKDKPSDEVKSVFVEVDHLELKVSGASQPWVRFAENFGAVDLMKLRDGVKLALEDLSLPEGSSIEQIRFYLKRQGNYIVRKDDSICDLQTPSQVESGLKVISPVSSIQIKAGRTYSLVIDFDVDHSIVLQGNGGCLLKPVIKLESATSIEIPSSGTVPTEGSAETEDETTESGTTTESGSTTESGTTTESGSTTESGTNPEVIDELTYQGTSRDELPPIMSADEIYDWVESEEQENAEIDYNIFDPEVFE